MPGVKHWNPPEATFAELAKLPAGSATLWLAHCLNVLTELETVLVELYGQLRMADMFTPEVAELVARARDGLDEALSFVAEDALFNLEGGGR